MAEQKTILVCPLDWGLGHATRDIPIIRHYLQKGDKVVLAGYGSSLHLLRSEFPQLQWVNLPGFSVSYARSSNQMLKLMVQVPDFIWWIKREHRLMKILVEEIKPHLIISDNRYGLWHRDVSSILITHQLQLMVPGWLSIAKPILRKKIQKWIERFDECWIPDNESTTNSLAGELSHPKTIPANAKYIGRLSRFSNATSTQHQSKYDVVAIVSGPEPQRSHFESILIKLLKTAPHSTLLVGGQPGNDESLQLGNITRVNHLPASEMETALKKASHIVCRAGYSGIMDLIQLRKNALLVSTPGQTEQEYLAKYLSEKGLFRSTTQNKLSLEEIISTPSELKVNNCWGLQFFPTPTN
jgi:predicted glycosyltransferase